MKKHFIILFSLLTFSFSSCEKDDICAGTIPTTPKVVIEFYDALNPTETKIVTNLSVVVSGGSNKLGFSGVSTIKVPLKTFENITSLQFIENGNDSDLSNDNIDELIFNYTTNDKYISRACGYITQFTLNSNNGVVLIPDNDNWIKSLTITQTAIVNENETHVKIYF